MAATKGIGANLVQTAQRQESGNCCIPAVVTVIALAAIAIVGMGLAAHFGMKPFVGLGPVGSVGMMIVGGGVFFLDVLYICCASKGKVHLPAELPEQPAADPVPVDSTAQKKEAAKNNWNRSITAVLNQVRMEKRQEQALELQQRIAAEQLKLLLDRVDQTPDSSNATYSPSRALATGDLPFQTPSDSVKGRPTDPGQFETYVDGMEEVAQDLRPALEEIDKARQPMITRRGSTGGSKEIRW